jgi:hypothetical protein
MHNLLLGEVPVVFSWIVMLAFLRGCKKPVVRPLDRNWYSACQYPSDRARAEHNSWFFGRCASAVSVFSFVVPSTNFPKFESPLWAGHLPLRVGEAAGGSLTADEYKFATTGPLAIVVRPSRVLSFDSSF